LKDFKTLIQIPTLKRGVLKALDEVVKGSGLGHLEGPNGLMEERGFIPSVHRANTLRGGSMMVKINKLQSISQAKIKA